MKSMSKNYIFNMLKSVMAILFPIISFPYASRVLGVNNIGIVSYCTSIISYFTLFASLGVSIYATREGAKIKDNQYELNKFSREVFFINLISTGIVYGIFLLLLFLNTFNGYFIVMLICSLAVWFTTFSIEWLYQLKEDFAYISIRSMIFQAISLVLLFVIVRTKNDYPAYAIIQVFASGGSCIFNLYNSKKYVNFFKKTPLDLKKHLKPIFTIFGVTAATTIYTNLDTVILGVFHSTYEVGLYTAAVKMVTIIRQIVNSLSVVALSRLSHYIGQNNKEEYSKLLKSNFDMNIGLVIPCVVGMIMLSKYFILFFSGADYLRATPASIILSINVITSVLDGMIYYQILIPNKMDTKAFIGTCVGAGANIILNLALVIPFGLEGVAFATLISEFSVFLVFYFYLKNNYNFIYLLSELPKALIACIPIVVICLLGRHFISNTLLLFIICIPLSAIGYFLLFKLLNGKLANDIFDYIKNKI
ncbi:flippase [Faecalibacillus faecis]|uniref:flippase n=1 Tax=Faecalibacillus faecis TaxID=1982628 RepID=UPI00386E5DA7